MKNTLTARILDYVTKNPGKTATEVSHALSARPCIVSGILCHMSQEVNGVDRVQNEKGTWIYSRE